MRMTAQDQADIASLLRSAFTTDFGGRSFFYQRHHVRLVLRDDRLVGHLGLTLRAIRINGTLTDVMLLGDVATDPDRRGQGIASRLLKAAIAEAQASPAKYFILMGDAGLYAGHGFAPVKATIRYADLTGAKTGDVDFGPTRDLMVLSLRKQDWPDDAVVDLVGGLF